MIAEAIGAGDEGGGCAFTMELRPGLSIAEADRRLAACHRAQDAGARGIAFYLADIAARDGHQELGYHSIEQYAEMRYHMAPATTRCYLATGRALQELPAIDEAFCRGTLCWSKVRELVRMATPETEQEWLKWARSRTAREIAAAARIRQKGERPTDPARRRIHEVGFRFQAQLNALDWTRWNTAREKLEPRWARPSRTPSSCARPRR